MSERPEWAKGPEWEGWTFESHLAHREGKGFDITINYEGWLHFFVGQTEVMDHTFRTSGDALNVANAFANAYGGWK